VLPAPARLRRREDFTLAVRRGGRAGRGTLVAHYLSPDISSDLADIPADIPAGISADVSADQVSEAAPVARVGFVVGRAVGNSVVRHRTVRRLRHLVRDRLDRLPAGSILVVRARPPAADADSATLGRDLDAALGRLLPAPAVTP
jgi:ribonuclease P protein component